MSSGVYSRRRHERFAELLDGCSRLRNHRRQSGAQLELARLAALARRLSAVDPGPIVAEEFRARLRLLLITTMDSLASDPSGPESTDAAGSADSRDAVGEAGSRGGLSAGILRPRTPSRGRARVAVLVGVTVGALALPGVSAASTDVLPGDPLYQVKRTGERAKLALATSDESRGQLYLGFARSRLREARKVGSDPWVDVLLMNMDQETVAGVSLLTTAAVHHGDVSGILNALTDFVNQQRARLAELEATLSVARTAPVRRSVALLDAVEQRVALLAGALAHDCAVTIVDKLGPQPEAC